MFTFCICSYLFVSAFCYRLLLVFVVNSHTVTNNSTPITTDTGETHCCLHLFYDQKCKIHSFACMDDSSEVDVGIL